MPRRWLLGLGALLVALLLVVPSAAGYYTDWLWYRELGYEHVFLRSLNAAGVFANSIASGPSWLSGAPISAR